MLCWPAFLKLITVSTAGSRNDSCHCTAVLPGITLTDAFVLKAIIMLRFLFVCFVLLLFSRFAPAQTAYSGKYKQNVLFVLEGVVLPLGNFASTDINNSQAGMAKTGFSSSILFNHRINKYVGVMLQGHYAGFALSDLFREKYPGATADHWQYSGLMVGPMLYLPVTNHILADVHVASGVIWTNSPLIRYAGETLIDEDWGNALTLQTGLHLRLFTNSSWVLFAGADYLQMKPEFRIAAMDPPEVIRKVNSLQLQAGIGFNF